MKSLKMKGLMTVIMNMKIMNKKILDRLMWIIIKLISTNLLILKNS